jgi:hypothetical protein
MSTGSSLHFHPKEKLFFEPEQLILKHLLKIIHHSSRMEFNCFNVNIVALAVHADLIVFKYMIVTF